MAEAPVVGAGFLVEGAPTPCSNELLGPLYYFEEALQNLGST